MKHQLLVVLLCASCGASALGTSVPAVSTLNVTDLGAAQGYGTDATAKTRKRRSISQNDMLAILDYHNKVRGRVFPPASNMEYMVSESFNHLLQNVQQLLVHPLVRLKCLCVRKGTTGAQITLQQTTKAASSQRRRVDVTSQVSTAIKVVLQLIFKLYMFSWMHQSEMELIHLCTSNNEQF